MRIVSLLPSATEIVYALGLDDQLVGVTFECDEPPQARTDHAVVVGGRDTTGHDAGRDRRLRARAGRGRRRPLPPARGRAGAASTPTSCSPRTCAGCARCPPARVDRGARLPRLRRRRRDARPVLARRRAGRGRPSRPRAGVARRRHPRGRRPAGPAATPSPTRSPDGPGRGSRWSSGSTRRSPPGTGSPTSSGPPAATRSARSPGARSVPTTWAAIAADRARTSWWSRPAATTSTAPRAGRGGRRGPARRPGVGHRRRRARGAARTRGSSTASRPWPRCCTPTPSPPDRPRYAGPLTRPSCAALVGSFSAADLLLPTIAVCNGSPRSCWALRRRRAGRGRPGDQGQRLVRRVSRDVRCRPHRPGLRRRPPPVDRRPLEHRAGRRPREPSRWSRSSATTGRPGPARRRGRTGSARCSPRASTCPSATWAGAAAGTPPARTTLPGRRRRRGPPGRRGGGGRPQRRRRRRRVPPPPRTPPACSPPCTADCRDATLVAVAPMWGDSDAPAGSDRPRGRGARRSPRTAAPTSTCPTRSTATPGSWPTAPTPTTTGTPPSPTPARPSAARSPTALASNLRRDEYRDPTRGHRMAWTWRLENPDGSEITDDGPPRRSRRTRTSPTPRAGSARTGASWPTPASPR